MRNLFENNERPEDAAGKPAELDESRTKTVRILHNGNVIGTGEVSIYGDVVSMNLNDGGVELLRSRVVLQVSDL